MRDFLVSFSCKNTTAKIIVITTLNLSTGTTFDNGQIQTQHTGVAGYDGKLFYVIKGELATDYKGTIKYNGAVYEVINGQLYKKK